VEAAAEGLQQRAAETDFAERAAIGTGKKPMRNGLSLAEFL